MLLTRLIRMIHSLDVLSANVSIHCAAVVTRTDAGNMSHAAHQQMQVIEAHAGSIGHEPA